jgi:CRISPR-associated endonuclease/helicase Cas3
VNGPYAHSRNDGGVRQELMDHLEAVAGLCKQHAEVFGAGELGRAAGLWHDLGKYHPEFQRYLLEAEAGERAAGTGPDHKGAGTIHAAGLLQLLTFPIAGHHGGLFDLAALTSRMEAWRGEARIVEALRRAPDRVKHPGVELRPPPFVQTALEGEFFVRMLFSALVDADYLDTERHFQFDRSGLRERDGTLAELWEHFHRHHQTLHRRDDEVSRIREEVYAACIGAADLPTGLFRLSVPTGGGKTLSVMAFALRHAMMHGLRRIIMAVPYTTITEQTATVYREAFGVAGAVLEHHSALDPSDADGQTQDSLWGRLAAENWDAPIIVTTTVQLFESLLARSTSKCRRIHRIAGSVIVLDEAQALPPHLLAPIMDTVRELTAHYGVSVVLCTATQPSLDDAPGFRGLPGIREIAPDPPRLFQVLRRVDYVLPEPGDSWSWARAAQEMRTEEQALSITNTIRDALALLDALSDPDAFHLSTLLCGAHRRKVLSKVRTRLKQGEPCRLVSTQVVEAGVDLDFPLVLRAVGPLDRIVQAAGRCNREGLLPAGRVVLFRPAEGTLPTGPYRTATDKTVLLLQDPEADLHDPQTYTRFFRQLYEDLDLDEENIQELRGSFRYEEVDRRFRMIRDDTTSVVVGYDQEATRLLERARSAQQLSRGLLRALQPYLVSLRSQRLADYERKGLVEEVREGLKHWVGKYDDQRGLVAESELLIV